MDKYSIYWRFLKKTVSIVAGNVKSVTVHSFKLLVYIYHTLNKGL
jgi:hypothetical protein